MVESNRELRARLLEESARKAREALMRGAAPRSYLPDRPAPAVSDTALAVMQAEAAARARTNEPPERAARQVAAVLPPQVQAAARVPVVNPKIWETDVDAAKPVGVRPDIDGWLTRVRLAARNLRVKGDPLSANIGRAAEAIVYRVRVDGLGFARISFESIANFAGFCVETGRKAVRFLEAHGLLDTFNVITRTADGDVWRAANLYFPRDLASAEPAPSSMGMLDRVTDRLRRYASAFKLKARPWGLNATPLRNPAPATPVQDTG